MVFRCPAPGPQDIPILPRTGFHNKAVGRRSRSACAYILHFPPGHPFGGFRWEVQDAGTCAVVVGLPTQDAICMLGSSHDTTVANKCEKELATPPYFWVGGVAASN